MKPGPAELVLAELLECGQVEAPADDVCRKLGLSPRELYEAVETLRAAGHDIAWMDHGASRGFVLRLQARPGLADLGSLLKTSFIGRNLVWQEEVGSTNDLARQLAEGGAPHGTVVVAGRQSAGRGRRGRTWVSLPGEHLYASVVLRPQLAAERAFEIVFTAALAAAEALEWAGVTPCVKWPNDLEVDDRKVAGILTELSDDGRGGVRHIVLGIGMNVNAPAEAIPEELRARATSVQAAAGVPVSCAHLAATLFERLEEWLVLARSLGFGGVLDSWRARSSTLGGEVRVLLGDGQAVAGVAEDVDESGALLVREASGRVQRILAGDVTTLRRA